MAIPSYGLGPERLFFPSPLTGSAALLPPTPPAAPTAPTGGSLLPALPPLPDPGGPPAGLEPPGPRTMADIISQDQMMRSLPALIAQGLIPVGAAFGALGRGGNISAARQSMNLPPLGFFDALKSMMPWSDSVVDSIASWNAGGHGPGIAQTGYGQEAAGVGQGGLPSLADLAASIAAGIAQFGDPGGGTDTASFGGPSSSDPGEAGGGGIW